MQAIASTASSDRRASPLLALGPAESSPSARRREAGMGRLKKPLIWVLVAFLVYAVFKSPDQAAGIVRGAWDGIISGLGAVAAFFDALLRG